MSLINNTTEKAVIERLQQIGPCHLDDLILSLPDLSWATTFATVDHLSREGRVSFRFGSYEIMPTPQVAPLHKVHTPINQSAGIPEQAA